MIASQLSGYCDVINNRLWHHQQNVYPVIEAQSRCVNSVILVFISLMFRNLGNKRQNNPLVSAETIRHSSTYTILYEVMFSCWIFSPVCQAMSVKLYLIKET